MLDLCLVLIPLVIIWVVLLIWGRLEAELDKMHRVHMQLQKLFPKEK